MNLDIATQILVVITSAVLIVFLVLAIVLMIRTIKIVRQVQRSNEKFQLALGNVNAVTNKVRTIVTPSVIIKLVAALVDQVTTSGHSTNNKSKSRKGGKK